MVLSRWCVGILLDTRSANVSFVWCEQKISYCGRQRDAIEAKVEVAEEDSELKCWFYANRYTNMYSMRGATEWTQASAFETSHQMAVRNPIFVWWQYFEMFTILPKDQHLHYVSVRFFWQNIEEPRLLFVPPSPMFAQYSSTFGDNTPRLAICYSRLP